VALALVGVESGSACPQLQVTFSNNQLVEPPILAYLERARIAICDAIEAANDDEPVERHLPRNLLTYFDRVGRGLRDGEAIEFAPGKQKSARLTKDSRRKLVLASTQQNVTEELTLRGLVPQYDQDKSTCTVKLLDGTNVPAVVPPSHADTILQAFNGYADGRYILLEGISRYDRNEKLKAIHSIQHVGLLDSDDLGLRAAVLKQLEKGWLGDGKGVALDSKALDDLVDLSNRFYPDDMPNPYLYPTAEGGVQLEWSLSGWEVTLEVDLRDQTGEWHVLHMERDDQTQETVNLNEQSGWQFVVDSLSRIGREPVDD
jgi:hypothetical protein